ncbi:MAG: hypothetical protein HRU00_09745 [Myxococcales bacterium]|nr:hypothetical protein [Myxococcales bacterium]
MTEGKDDAATVTIGDVIAELKFLMDGAPPGQWVWCHDEFVDTEDGAEAAENMLAFMYASIGSGDSISIHGVKLKGGPHVCLTGNGEHARRYSRMLMLVHAVLPFILELLEQAGETPLPDVGLPQNEEGGTLQ